MGERKQALLSRHNIIISAFVLYFFSFVFFPLPTPGAHKYAGVLEETSEKFPGSPSRSDGGVGGATGSDGRAPVQAHGHMFFFVVFFAVAAHPFVTDRYRRAARARPASANSPNWTTRPRKHC